MIKPRTYPHTLPGGAPVPFIAHWTSEVTEYYEPCQETLADVRIGEDFLQGRGAADGPPLALYFDGGPGEGAPILGKHSPARQRAVVAGQRCQVCGGRLQPGGHLAIDLHVPGPPNAAGTPGPPQLSEPWACARCLAVSLVVCPPLAARVAELTVITLARWNVEPAWLKREGLPRPVLAYLSLVPTQIARSEPAAAFLGRMARQMDMICYTRPTPQRSPTP